MSKLLVDTWLRVDDEIVTIVLIVASILSIIWLVRILTSKKFNPPLPPGPRSLPLIGNLLSLDPELHVYFASLAKVHGPIARLWLGKKLGILITSPELAREVLKLHDTTFANRDVPIAGVEATYGGNDIVSSPYGDQWRMLRKICVREMLSNQTLDSVYSLRRREVRNTITYLYNHFGQPVNIGEQMFLTVLNVITGMMWGGTVKAEDRTTIGAEFRQVVNEMVGYLGKPNLSDFYPSLALFDLQGTDTTSNTIEFALAEMMNKPEILRKAQQELEDVVGKDNIVEESHINKLPYLYAIMKEVLRMHPTLPLLVPHCPSESCVIGGYTIPKGARVFVNAWAIHRDPSIWENPGGGAVSSGGGAVEQRW
uniref:Flavonoid 3'-monooxygenase-like n=1 Tax=Tanacetum cinerariifolium TaxID=118510 RepID=A0A6L2MMS6_TANCI|nr:flavonoid 3'-monooxygenase-like [Tanacetum cinerariifolium]